MITHIPGDLPPPVKQVVPSVSKVQPIPSHGFLIEDTVTLHNQREPEDEKKRDE